ncbi:MAG: hypothetical protein PVF58_08070 [Candidatus Methanofastidiosia archaeon]|jgi:hypothetical protein
MVTDSGIISKKEQEELMKTLKFKDQELMDRITKLDTSSEEDKT